MGGMLTLTPQAVAVEPGAETTVTLGVRNTGTTVEAYALDVLGPSAAWAKVEPLTLNLYPGADGTATVRFNPPAGTAPGPLAYGIRLRSLTTPGDSLVEEGELTIGGASLLTARLVPTTSEAKRRATHRVLLANAGNVPLSVHLTAEDADEHLAFEITPSATTVPPGGNTEAVVKVSARSKVKAGGGLRRRAFAVNAIPIGGAPVRLDGALEQQPGTSIWPKVGIAAVVVAAVLTAVVVTNKGDAKHEATLTTNGNPFGNVTSAPVAGGATTPGITTGPNPTGNQNATVSATPAATTTTATPTPTASEPAAPGEGLPSGEMRSSPDAISLKPGQLDVYWRGTDETLWHSSKLADAPWTPGATVGVPNAFKSGPGMANWGETTIHAFVHGMDEKLYDIVFDGTWHAPALVDPTGTGAGVVVMDSPDATSRHAGHLDVVFHGADRHLWHVWRDDPAGVPWSGPEQLGGDVTFNGSPTITSPNDTRSDVFAHGDRHELLHAHWDPTNGWGAFAPVGTLTDLTSGVDAVHVADPASPLNVTVCYRTGSSKGGGPVLCRTAMDAETYSNPVDVGGAGLGDPTVTSSASNRLDLFLHDHHHALRYKFFDGTWHL